MRQDLLSFDLLGLLDEVRRGRITAQQGIDRVDAMRQAMHDAILEDAMPVPHVTWLKLLTEQTQAAFAQLEQDPLPVRVLDCGRVVSALAGSFPGQTGLYAKGRIARRLIDLDRPEWALKYFLDDLHGLEHAQGDLRQEIRRVHATAFIEARRPQDALPVIDALLTEARDTDTRVDLAIGLLLQAQALNHSGSPRDALVKAREGLAAWQGLSAEDRPLAYAEATYREQIGYTARASGQFEEALSAFEESARLWREAGDAARARLVRSEIGYTWQRAGDMARGQEILSGVADEAEAGGERTRAQRWRGGGWPQYAAPDESPADQLGRAVTLLSADPPNPDAALTLLRMALGREERNPALEHMVRNVMSRAFSMQGHHLQAEMAGREAVFGAREAGDASSELVYRVNLARLLAARRRPDEAEQELQDAIRLGETIRSGTATAELRQTVGVVLAGAYELMAFLASNEYRNAAGTLSPARPQLLFEAGQGTRAVNLTRWLALGELVERNRPMHDALTELRLADAHLEAEAQDRDEPLAPLARAHSEARARWEDLARAHGVPIEPASRVESAAAVRSALPGRTILDVLSLAEGVSINVLDPGRPETAEFLRGDRTARTELIGRWHRLLTRVTRAEAEGTSDAPGARSDRDAFDAASAALDAALTAPLARALEASSSTFVTVFPHRELFQFPFWRLARYLPGVAISVLPGPGSAAILSRRLRTAEGPSIAFGDATGTLLYADDELSAIGCDEICEARASVLRERAASAREVHFAGHGYFNRRNPYYSGLVVRAAAEDADPLIVADPWGLGLALVTTAWILGRLDMPRCRLAVLSACHTGVPREHPASEFTSLPAALLVAGSRNVIASVWQAHDGATRLLMEAFYDLLRRQTDGFRPSLALAEARRRLARMSREDAVARLGATGSVPSRPYPFDAPYITDMFQHYGVD